MKLGVGTDEPAMPPILIFEGIRLLWHPELRWLVLMPLLINAGLFFSVTLTAVNLLDAWLNQMMASLPTWLDWLAVLVWILFAALATVLYAFGFTLLAHLIGSPFYGLIAERVLNLPTEMQGAPDGAASRGSAASTAWQSFLRQLHFLQYLLPRSLGMALLAFILGFVPLLNFAVPVMVAAWAAWALALQYLDYSADADGRSFDLLRQRAGQRRGQAISFGLCALLVSAIPFFNLITVPATVIAGALLWRQEFQSR